MRKLLQINYSQRLGLERTGFKKENRTRKRFGGGSIGYIYYTRLCIKTPLSKSPAWEGRTRFSSCRSDERRGLRRVRRLCVTWGQIEELIRGKWKFRKGGKTIA